MKTYKVGFIGFGFIGKVHAYGYLNFPLYYDPLNFRTEITHICTSSMATAEKGCRQVNAAVPTTDFRKITENPDIDIVHICTPNHLHLEALLSAIANQKHIYCDKPLVANLSEAEQVRAALKGYAGTAQMTFQLRFYAAIMRAKQLLTEGFIGRPLEFRATFLHSGSADPNAPLKWKLSAAAGAGVIADLGSHVFDLVHYLLGDFEEIAAQAMTAYPERPAPDQPGKMLKSDTEDRIALLVRMRNGAVGTMEATKLATGTEDEIRIEIHGSRGALRFNGVDAHFLEAYDASIPDRPMGGQRGWTRIAVGQRYPEPAGFPGGKLRIGWMRSHMACLYNFMADVTAGKKGDPSLEQGIYIQHIMDGAARSAAEKKWVTV